MAGIGFELRRLLKKESLFGIIRAYSYAGVISSGPWVLSILCVMLIGVLSIGRVIPQKLIVQYLVSVTHLMAASLIATSPLQLLFTRFISDRLFEKRDKVVLPNLLGALLITTLVSGILGIALTLGVLREAFLYELLMVASFVTLANIWVVVIFLSGMKSYHAILAVFFGGYGTAFIASLLLRSQGMVGLLSGFFIGQCVLFFAMIYLVIRQYPGEKLLAFEFLSPRRSYYSLAATGLMFNLAIWADKFIFWWTPAISQPIIGPLRASIIYDLPIFLAYLSIIPGMSVFLVRMETDFVESYDKFYSAVRHGDTLDHIRLHRRYGPQYQAGDIRDFQSSRHNGCPAVSGYRTIAGCHRYIAPLQSSVSSGPGRHRCPGAPSGCPECRLLPGFAPLGHDADPGCSS